MGLDDVLKTKKVVIVSGSGGVGKTTLSAAIAVHAAKSGKKTLVLTIDPAKRLAQTLGIDRFDHRPKAIPLGKDVKLWAMMLDTKETLDHLIRQYAPSQEITDKILKNRIYQYLSTMLAGTEDYMALEKLYELWKENHYDFIVIDTPPAKHALNFLEAPEKLANFLDENILKWFLKPYFLAGKLSIQFLSAGSYFVFKIIERFTGLQLFYELSEFFINLQTLYTGFRERTLKAREILGSRDTAFLLATVPEKRMLEEASRFYERLIGMKLPFGGIIINRILAEIPMTADERQRLENLKLKISQKFLKKDRLKLEIFDQWEQLAKRERRETEQFKKSLPTGVPVYEIPFFAQDIYDIKGLDVINQRLFQ